MYAAHLPSGETLELGGAFALDPPESAATHVYDVRSHRHRRCCSPTVIDRLSFARSNVVPNAARRLVSTRPPDAAASAAASRVWSNSDSRVRFAGSTMTNALPFTAVVRYQRRPSGRNVGRKPSPVTSGT